MDGGKALSGRARGDDLDISGDRTGRERGMLLPHVGRDGRMAECYEPGGDWAGGGGA